MKNLYNLIQNLSQSEKRYIKLRLTSTKSSSDTLNYFDALGKQSEYNFEALKKIDNKTTTVLRSNLDKLYRSVLKQLRLFHSNINPETKLQGILFDVNLLREKGLIVEAKKLNAKLIKLCKQEEQFQILHKALSNQWLLHHLSGMLSFEMTNDLELEISECKHKENELEELNSLYRRGVSLYYSYFFKAKKPIYLEEIQLLLDKNLLRDLDALKSASSKMVGYEISSLCHMVLGDLKNHHVIRKDQLKLLFTSPIFKTDFINKLLVTSNVFTYLKSKAYLEEFTAYLNVYKNYFEPIVEKTTDNVLIEKYYDVLFQNSIYKTQYLEDPTLVFDLIDLFNKVTRTNVLNNTLLINRTYLSLAEALVLKAEYKKAIPLLIEYQDRAKANRASKSYIDSELLFLFIYREMGKVDAFESKISSLDKAIKTKEIPLDQDQEVFLNILQSIYYDRKVSTKEIELVKKRSVKLMATALLTQDRVIDLISTFFSPSKEDYLSKEDEVLKCII